MTLNDSYDPIGSEPEETRLAMFRNGYEPIPLVGKRPITDGWQCSVIDESTIAFMSGPNTGIRTAHAPTIDVDIPDAAGAGVVRAILEQLLGGRGKIIERVGQYPKFAIPLRTEAPFKKIIRKFRTEGCKTYKIEVLAEGQQIAAAGIHPDTKEPFRWRSGLSPVNTPRSELPLVDEAEIHSMLDFVAGRLLTQLGRIEVSGSSVDRVDLAADNVLPFTPLKERVEKIAHGGEYPINDTLLAYTMDQLDNGVPVDDVIEDCLKRTNDCLSQQERGAWNWNNQRHQFREMCLGHISKKHGERPSLIDLLPGALRQKWLNIESDGGQPILRKRKHWGVESAGPAEPIPDVEITNVEIPTIERKIRFRLISFQDMRPGIEPSYLVDELIPSAGLVLVWGRQKTFKSFWLLDLCVHIALGRPYRDHAVRQGMVVYCALEGGHGYKGRIEAIRRHHSIADDVDVPLYVMPGQVNLIQDAPALVREFREQLGDRRPSVVVLDTLNRSLAGSESSDKDMTLYVKAAEEIRKAFGCVCIIVHHCGYDDTHARGHTSLPAAVDAELSVERAELSPNLVVTVRQMRDGPEGMVVRGRAHVVQLDADQNGRPRSSIVIVPDDSGETVIPTRHGGRRDVATPLLAEVVRAVMDTDGFAFTPDDRDAPAGG